MYVYVLYLELYTGIPTLNPRGTHQWSSKTLARFIFGDDYPRLYLFSDSKELFRPKRIQEALDKELGLVTEHVDQDGMQDEGMGMEIDDGWLVSDEPPPQHILDDLHDQIIDHFSILLRRDKSPRSCSPSSNLVHAKCSAPFHVHSHHPLVSLRLRTADS